VDEVNLEDSTPGFVFAPFLPEEKKILFPADLLFRFVDGVLIEAPPQDSYNFNHSDEQHIHSVNVRKSENLTGLADFKNLDALSAKKIEAGSIFLNSIAKSHPALPIGGIKKSGFGRELSHYGIKEFVNIKTMNVYDHK